MAKIHFKITADDGTVLSITKKHNLTSKEALELFTSLVNFVEEYTAEPVVEVLSTTEKTVVSLTDLKYGSYVTLSCACGHTHGFVYGPYSDIKNLRCLECLKRFKKPYMFEYTFKEGWLKHVELLTNLNMEADE